MIQPIPGMRHITSSEEAAFIQAIIKGLTCSGTIPYSEDETARKVYSDWLEEDKYPEFFVVRYYPPWIWTHQTAQGDGHIYYMPWFDGWIFRYDKAWSSQDRIARDVLINILELSGFSENKGA